MAPLRSRTAAARLSRRRRSAGTPSPVASATDVSAVARLPPRLVDAVSAATVAARSASTAARTVAVVAADAAGWKLGGQRQGGGGGDENA